MARKDRPQFAKARAFLLSSIENGEFADLGKVPPLPALSRAAGVSVFTMWKVVEALRREGLLARVRGHRAIVPGLEPEPASPAPNEPRVRRTRQHTLQLEIRRDILNGEFRHDAPLPAEKELTSRYGVSRMTLRKALLALAEQSILDRNGPRFSPASLIATRHAPARRIVFLGQGENMGHSISWGYWHQEYLKLLELECSRARIAVDVVCFSRCEDGIRLTDGRTDAPFDLGDRSDVVGYVYEATNPESLDEALLTTVARAGLPVAVLDEMGSWPSSTLLRRHPNVRVFRNTVSALPALQVARFVLELGHRTAVFISPQHGLEFSQQRYDGLMHAFAAHPQARIVAVTSHRDAEAVEARAIADVNLQEFMSFYARWKRPLSPAYTGHLDNHMEMVRSIAFDGAVREDLTALFKRALAVKGATVWVAVNDFCAHAACDFLRDRRVAIPRKLSLISFDDTPVAVIKGITSYNFGNAATMMAMLRFVTNPRLFPVRKPVIEIQGHIVSRRTTAGPL